MIEKGDHHTVEGLSKLKDLTMGMNSRRYK